MVSVLCLKLYTFDSNKEIITNFKNCALSCAHQNKKALYVINIQCYIIYYNNPDGTLKI